MARRALIAVTSMLVAILALTIGLEVIAYNQLSARLSLRTLIEQRPPPYANSPYWSEEFLHERWELADYFVIGEDGYELRDYAGEYFNFRNGERVTVAQPVNYQNTIYVFGSSTVFDGEVPDEFTFTSQMQAAIGENYRVVNRGVVALVDSQIQRRIEDTPLSPGDIVVFYEPWNDFLPVMRSSVEQQKTTLCRLLSTLPIIQNRAITIVSCRWSSPLQANDWERLDTMRTQIIETVGETRSYVEASGANFIYVLPPLLWAKQEYSSYEELLLGNIDSLPEGLFKLASQIPALDMSELQPLDLYHLLDHEENVFVTHNHVNERGNEIIAQRLVEAIGGLR